MKVRKWVLESSPKVPGSLAVLEARGQVQHGRRHAEVTPRAPLAGQGVQLGKGQQRAGVKLMRVIIVGVGVHNCGKKAVVAGGLPGERSTT